MTGAPPPGYTIANRRIEKVFPADDLSGVAIAGAAGPAVEMVRLFQVQLEHYEKIEGETLSLEGKANQLGQMVRSNLPAAMQGFAVVPLFAGYDERRDLGRVFSYDVTGGKYEEADFQTNGSGRRARPQLDQGHVAGGHDAATTPSTSRSGRSSPPPTRTPPPVVPTSSARIFPMVAVIDATGYAALDDDHRRRDARRRCTAAAKKGAGCEHAASTSRPSR